MLVKFPDIVDVCAVPAEVLFVLLYVAVMVLVPAATPVAENCADCAPIGTITVAGTVIFAASELDKDTLADSIAALVSATVRGNVPPTPTVNDVGVSDETIGFVGVVPSVVS